MQSCAIILYHAFIKSNVVAAHSSTSFLGGILIDMADAPEPAPGTLVCCIFGPPRAVVVEVADITP